MKNQVKREKEIIKHSKKNRWYEYERYKTYLSLPVRDAEIKILTKDFRV